MNKDLLLEIGTEEIPAKFMPGALSQLQEAAAAALAAARISYTHIRTVGTPRRLTLLVDGLASEQADQHGENKGPSIKIAFDAAGLPTKAAQGFARGQGIDVSQLVVKDEYVYAIIQQAGQPTAQLLPQLLTELIQSLTFSKSMRWGQLEMKFIRPIRWLVALFGEEVVPFTVAEVASGNTSVGHRFLSKGPVVISSASNYFAQMATHHVMVDQVERRQVIRQQVEKLALKQGGTASIDEELLEEVLYLVEYPTALCGSFDEKYLSLPPEAVITPMREHQRYFPVFGQDGKLLPVFITVRNGGAEYLDIVRHGNERVLKARLADARFFFEEDKKVALAQRVDKLKAIVYQEGLGSLWDKTTRLEKLVGHLAKLVGLAEGQLADLERSAHLAKADLVTGMVGEFAELQGVMGREYALLDGEPAMVADAIFEHYLPRFAGDKLPESQAGALLSLADKMDNLVATFSRGLIPSGSQDPFALRRQAAGMVAILIRKKLHISLARFASYAMELLGVTDQDKQAALIAELQEFFRLRLKNILTEEGLRYDMIDAVLGLGCDDVYDMWLRAQALSQESGSSRMETAVRAFTRVGNLAKNTVGEHIDPSLLEAGAEQALFQAYSAAEKQMNQLMAEGKYREALQVVAGLAQPIDGFFGQVMVMVEDLPVRNNRLALLKAITRLAGQIADLGKLATN